MPQSTSTWRPDAVLSRCLEPVTVCAAPRKVRSAKLGLRVGIAPTGAERSRSYSILLASCRCQPHAPAVCAATTCGVDPTGGFETHARTTHRHRPGRARLRLDRPGGRHDRGADEGQDDG